MIIGKFLDPRAPSLPQQVGINTDDIAEIVQENEEQSANIQQNTDDIELLKRQVSESGTRVRVDGELVAEWSPDELTDDLQQVRLAQASDSLAIVGLQSDNITNKQNIASIQQKLEISPPVNSYLIQKTGTPTPASIYSGTWIKVAENVILPFGNIAPVKPNASDVVTGAQSRVNLRYTSGGVVSEQNYLMSYDGGLYNSRTTTGEAVSGIYFSNLVAEAESSLAGVDIWLREE